jgi:hypothetical protein
MRLVAVQGSSRTYNCTQVPDRVWADVTRDQMIVYLPQSNVLALEFVDPLVGFANIVTSIVTKQSNRVVSGHQT